MRQAAPLGDCYQYGSFDAASGYDLRPIAEACIENSLNLVFASCTCQSIKEPSDESYH
jgi:hypothetical protein